MKNKIDWIDNLKGLAIIAVVIGHVASPLTGFIYAWHIPLFFFVSGLLINTERSLKDSLKKDFTRLIIPFIVFSLVGLGAEYLKRWLFPGFPFINGEIKLGRELIGIFWWMDYSHLHHYGFVLWFLPALFWAKNIYRLLVKIFRNKHAISFLCLILLIYTANTSWGLPFGIDKALVGIFWLSVGWLITGKFWYLTLLAITLLPLPQSNIALKVISIYGIVYSLIAINTLTGIIRLVPSTVKIISPFGQKTMFVLIIHPYINNIAFLLFIEMFRIGWLPEIIFILCTLSIMVRYKDSVIMVLKYIYFHNTLWLFPYIAFKSLVVIIFQLITNKEIIKNLKWGRKIILFPGCVISRMFLYTEIPDSDEINLLRKYITKDTIFLDIGANVGNYSVLLSDLTKNIYAFEPSPLSLDRCRRNFIINGLDPDHVIPLAISDKVSTSGFTDLGGSSTLNHLSEMDKENIQVKTGTLDRWINKSFNGQKLNIIINIDVEGHEAGVLKGAKMLLKSNMVSFMLMEILDKKSVIFNMLKTYGYRVKHITGNNYYVKKV